MSAKDEAQSTDHEGRRPFEPTPATIAAMEEARRGGSASFDTLEALMRDLHADD